MICTFYSYKGGVGRSMALANVGDVLSRRGLKVLMIDFDLEAPGLEQFFYRSDERELRDAIRSQTGLLDLLLAYKESMSVAGGGDSFRDIERYIATVFGHRPGGGRLDLMPAGQRLSPAQMSHYALALRTFDWQDFYFNWEGDLFFEWLRRSLLPERYDLVLIDSRTGVTEMGGICGYQLADVIVMMCGANHQNVDGTWSMLQDFRSQPVEDLRRGRPVEIVVVPARLEQRAPLLTEAFYERFDARFAALQPPRLAEAGLSFRDLTIPYDPQFAFEERVARSPEEKAAKEHLGQVFGTLADVITLLVPASSPVHGVLARQNRELALRLRSPAGDAAAVTAATSAAHSSVAAQYDETKFFAEYDLLLSFAPREREAAAALEAALATQGLRIRPEAAARAVARDWQLRMKDTLAHARALAVCLGAEPSPDPQQWLLAQALRANEAGRALPVVAVLMPGHEADHPSDPLLQRLPLIDLRRGMAPDTLLPLLQLLQTPSPGAKVTATAAPTVELEQRCPWVGPRPYGEHQTDLFFGRAEALRALREAIESTPVVVLTGPSACGKSSLAMAGLWPALRPAHPDWRLVHAEGLTQVTAAIARAGTAAHTTPGKVKATQASDGTPGPEPLFVLIDPVFAPGSTALNARDTMAAAIAALATVIEHGGRILLCLRSDQIDAWTDACASAGAGPALASPGRIALHAPGAGALRELVERPADTAGIAFEPGLVDRLLNRAAGEPGALPFLQRTLVRLWEQRRNGWLTNAAYDAFGGLRAVVTEAAEQHYQALTAEDRDEARRLLLRLVQVAPGGTRSTAQRVPLESIGSEGSPARRVLDGLIDAGLLVSDADSSGASVELAHEALAREWPRLLVWLEQERDFLAWRARLVSELEAWRRAGRTAEQLLRGPTLDEAERMSLGREADLHQEEREFIGASLAMRKAAVHEAERRRQRRLVLLGSVATVFLMVATIAAFGWLQAFRQQTELQLKSDALTAQLRELERSSSSFEAERAQNAARLAELEATLSEILQTARHASDERDRAQATVAELERAVNQAREVAVEQSAYSARQIEENTRQQTTLRNVLKSAPQPVMKQ
ncbi:MAG: hypothetical protein Q7J47_19520 [Azoarcus sp.]|nr:hypothetical protein [Azoarcus sp.]